MAENNFMSVQDVNKKLDKGLEMVFQQERFKDLLTLMSRFHNYSINNTILIMTQRPNATMVQGFKGWQELGRHVKQGEKAIKILAPMFKKVEMDKIDPITNKPVINEKGDVIKEKKDVLIGFRLVSVFDVSQTDGKEIPSVRDFIASELKDEENISKLYRDYFQHIKENYHYDIKEAPTEKGVGGYFDRKTDEIVISSNNTKNDAEKFRVLIHEFAHAQLHHTQSELKDLPRGHKEAQAESVAYIVSNYYGLETDDTSLGYIATWAQDLELARTAISEIQEVANKIIQELDELQRDKILEFYNSQEKEYNDVKNYLANQFNLNLDDLKDHSNHQLEILHKESGMVISARLEYSEKNEKFHLRTQKNMIIPLSELHEKGNYFVTNKELEKDKVVELSEYRRIPDFLRVTNVGNKYVVNLIGGTELVSREFTNKEDADKHFLKLALAQSLHHQSFIKSQLKEQTHLKDYFVNLQKEVNENVSKYLTHNTNKVFVPQKEDGTTIGWALMKNKITSIEKLEEYAHSQKFIASFQKLQSAIENTVRGELEQTSVVSDLKVMKSRAGFYVGRTITEGDHEMPYSRESEYFKTEKEAQKALNERTKGKEIEMEL
ncbi:MAG TPA: ArdC family protein [Metabacillus sp.]|nr:ArdC family protein [Metabacillus sp.]